MGRVFVYKGDDQEIPEDVELVRIDPAVKIIDKYAFEDFQKLKHVQFSNGLQEVGSNAFSNCVLLESIRLPSTVRVIQKGAFFNCENLKYVVLNEGLEVIEKDAFSGCGMEFLWLPSTVKYARTGAFDNCRNLKRVALNEGLVKVENYAFNQCDMLESIEIPPSLDSSSILEAFAVPEKTVRVSVKDDQFWYSVQSRYEGEENARMKKYGIDMEEDVKIAVCATLKPSPADESSQTNKPGTPTASRKLYGKDTRGVIQQKLVDKQQQIEWLQKLLASSQKERDELQAKLDECDMMPPSSGQP